MNSDFCGECEFTKICPGCAEYRTVARNLPLSKKCKDCDFCIFCMNFEMTFTEQNYRVFKCQDVSNCAFCIGCINCRGIIGGKYIEDYDLDEEKMNYLKENLTKDDLLSLFKENKLKRLFKDEIETLETLIKQAVCNEKLVEIFLQRKMKEDALPGTIVMKTKTKYKKSARSETL